MAGFESLIRGALEKQGDPSPENRAAVYNSSRQALERMLSQNTTMDPATKKHQRQRLEQAISAVDAGYGPPGGAVASAPTSSEPATGIPARPSAEAPAVSAPPSPKTTPDRPVDTLSASPVQSSPPVSPPPVAAPGPKVNLPNPDAVQSQTGSLSPEIKPAVASPVAPIGPVTAAPSQQSVPSQPPLSSPPPSPSSAPAKPIRVEPGFQAPPIPEPPKVDPLADLEDSGIEPTIMEDTSGTQLPEGFPDLYREPAGRERKPFAKMLLWTIILVGMGVAVWWAINFGPALLQQQLGGSVPNPGQTIESGGFVPEGEADWVKAFDPIEDTTNIDIGERGSANLFQDGDSSFVRLTSNTGSSDNNIRVVIPRGIMVPLKGEAVVFEVTVRSAREATQQIAVFCEFSEMGNCGRKRFTATSKIEAQIFDVIINNTELAANEDAYLSFNTDLSGSGKSLDLFAIRVRVNR